MGGKDGEGTNGEGGKNSGPAKFEMTDEIREALGPVIGQAVANHLKRGAIRDIMGELVDGAVKKHLDPVMAKLAEMSGGEGEGNGKPKGGEAKDAPIPAAMQAQFDRMARENKQLADTLKATQDASAAKENANRQQKERTALVEALVASGVAPVTAKAVATYLHVEQKRVATGEDGVPTFAVATAYGTEAQPIDKGIAAWLKTDEGRNFLPPVDASGSGNLGGGRRLPPGQKPTRTEALLNLGNNLMKDGVGS